MNEPRAATQPLRTEAASGSRTDRPVPETDLGLFFHPRTIALIGATDDRLKPGFALLRKIMVRAERDGAAVYPVNPRLDEIEGVRCYPSLADVPGEVDVVVVMIGDAERGVREAVAKGARFCIVFTAGFREVGEEGARREEALARIAREGGMRLFGPNTNVNAFETFPDLPGRAIALITQSGHQGRPIAQGAERGIALSAWAPTGNEADLEAADFIEYFASREDTGAIAGYIEGFRSIPRLREAAEAAARAGVPIVLIKVGRTEAGRRMAMAHTGHLTGSDAIHDAFFRQYGIVRVDDLDEVLETAALFCRVPRPATDGICIYAISGGTGAHCADLFAVHRLALPPLGEHTQAALRDRIPDYLTVANPVDNGAQGMQKPGFNRELIELCLDDPAVGILVCPITGVLPSMSKIVCGDIVDAHRSGRKPVVVIWGSPVTDEGYRMLLDAQVPLFHSFRAAALGLHRAFDYWGLLDGFEPRPVPPPACPPDLEPLLSGEGPLSEAESAAVCARYGIRFPTGEMCRDAGEAAAAAARLGGRVVMKACGRGILHKSDAGLVRLGVPAADAARTFDELERGGRAAAGPGGFEGVLVQETAPDGVEVIVGVDHDPQFGPVVVFGLGGIFVEVLRDVAMRVAPLTRRDAESMIREVRGFPLLDGARGRPRADLDALAEVLLGVSAMALDLREQVAELDLNPVRVLPAGEGVVALDALLVRRGR